MTKLGKPIPESILNIRNRLQGNLDEYGFKYIDADSLVTGKDFLLKIWQLILSVPIGIGIITEELNQLTMANIFYEIGLMQALGKETVIIKSEKIKAPSDFIRTEYIQFDNNFKEKLDIFFNTMNKTAEHFFQIGKLVENYNFPYCESSLSHCRTFFLFHREFIWIVSASKILIEEIGIKQPNQNHQKARDC